MSPPDTVDFGHRQFVIRREPAVALRVPRRSLVVVSLLAVLALVLAVLALGVGQYDVAPPQVIAILLGRDDSFAMVLVLEWRMPRILLALLIGGALGMSGTIFQALTRNPLGSPDVIGFDFGAYAGALIAIAVLGGGYYTIAVSAVVGGLLTAVAVYLLSYRNGLAGFRLIIVGIAVSAVLSSLCQWIILKIRLHQAVTASIWQQGSLSGLEWAQVLPVVGGLAIAVVTLVAAGPALPILQLGDDAAGVLGLRPDRIRMAYFGVGVLLIAVAAAAAGPISFVALAAPQLARRLTGAPGVGLASAAVMGALLLLASDLIAMTIFAPAELPVGAVTVTLGGLYLVYLLVAQARRRGVEG